MSHLVVSATQLEAEDGLQVFTLQHDLAFQTVAEVDGMRQRCLLHDFVDARGQDETEILLDGQRQRRVSKGSGVTSGYPLGRRKCSGTPVVLTTGL